MFDRVRRYWQRQNAVGKVRVVWVFGMPIGIIWLMYDWVGALTIMTRTMTSMTVEEIAKNTAINTWAISVIVVLWALLTVYRVGNRVLRWLERRMADRSEPWQPVQEQ